MKRRGYIRDEELHGHYIDWDALTEKGHFSNITNDYYNKKRGSLPHRKWRVGCLRRDDHQCVLCGSEENLHVHHLLRWYDKPSARYLRENGATLCKVCHLQGHGRYGDDFPKELTTRIVKILASRGQKYTKRCHELLALSKTTDIPRVKTRLIKRQNVS